MFAFKYNLNMKKAVIILSLIVPFLAACTKPGLNSLTFLDGYIGLYPGQIYQASLVADPFELSDPTLYKWTSSNTEVADVDDMGYIIAKSVGDARVTAAMGKHRISLDVYVNELDVTYFSAPAVFKIAPSTTKSFDIEDVVPAIATAENLIVEIDNPEFINVKVTGNTVKVTAKYAMKKGDVASITLVNKSGSFHKKIVVQCAIIAVTGISLDNTSLSLYVGEKASLNATVLPADATYSSITWTSSNESVAKYNEDYSMVEAISEGNAVITASCGTIKATCNVTVKGTSLIGKSVMFTGEENSITMALDGVEATLWKTSDASIAKVAGGKVIGLKPGWVTVIATYGDNKQASKEIRVVNKDFRPALWFARGKISKLDPAGNPIYKFSERMTSVSVLPSYGSARAYVGTDDGYSLSYAEIDELYGKTSLCFKETRTGEPMMDSPMIHDYCIYSSYVKSAYPGMGSISTITAPNGNTCTLNWNKSIGSITISFKNSLWSTDKTIPVGSSFTITEEGNYYFMAGPANSYKGMGDANYGPIQKMTSNYGYTLQSSSANLKLNSSFDEGFKFDSSVPKGTYTITVKEYPSVTFSIIWK